MFIKYNPNLKSVAKEMRNSPTDSEKEMWNFLRSEFPLLHFMRQKSLSFFIVDFYCSKLHLIIEVDGEVHDSQRERDLERDSHFLDKFSISTLRFGNQDVKSNKNKIKLLIEKYVEGFIPPLDSRGG